MKRNVRFGSLADIAYRSASGPPYPQKRTWVGTIVMSALCHFRAKCIAAK
jgi:hypothetical protein